MAAPGNPIVVTHHSGVRFAIRIRSHELFVDQTVNGGGCDSAPTPVELLGASLGGCIAYYVHHFFHTRGLPAEGVRVEVSQTSSRDPHRVESFSVTVSLPADIPDRYLPLIRRVIEACPAHNTLTMGAKVAVKVEEPVAELVGS
jgi:putative redox protein